MNKAEKSGLSFGPKKPDLEINKPGPGRFWQRPGNML